MRSWLAGGLSGLGVLLAAPLDAATTSSFQVTAQIVAGCLVVGGVTSYGTLDYGSQSALATGTLGTSLGGTTVTFQCTPGVALSMSVDGGLYSSTGRNLQLNSGSAFEQHRRQSGALGHEFGDVQHGNRLGWRCCRAGFYGGRLVILQPL